MRQIGATAVSTYLLASHSAATSSSCTVREAKHSNMFHRHPCHPARRVCLNFCRSHATGYGVDRHSRFSPARGRDRTSSSHHEGRRYERVERVEAVEIRCTPSSVRPTGRRGRKRGSVGSGDGDVSSAPARGVWGQPLRGGRNGRVGQLEPRQLRADGLD